MKDILSPKITMLTTGSANSKRLVSNINVGDIFPTTRGGDVTVLAIDGYSKILVRFNDSNAHEVTTDAGILMKGNVKNPYTPMCCGVGYIGVGEFTSKKHALAYAAWRDMLRRCYDSKVQDKMPTYVGCSVHLDWHNFQNFAKWYTRHDYYDMGYHLDKDLLIRGNKIYSKDTCSLVPARINTILTNLSSSKSKKLTGVTYQEDKGLFQARIRNSGIVRNLGFFETEIEAHNAYVKGKERIVKMVALEHRYDMEESVFKSLMDWRFEL